MIVKDIEEANLGITRLVYLLLEACQLLETNSPTPLSEIGSEDLQSWYKVRKKFEQEFDELSQLQHIALAKLSVEEKKALGLY
jgi:hypothetical protein